MLYLLLFRTMPFMGLHMSPFHPTYLITMMLTLRVIGIAFERKDALSKLEKDKNNLTEAEKDLASFSITSMFFYCFNYIGIMIGESVDLSMMNTFNCLMVYFISRSLLHLQDVSRFFPPAICCQRKLLENDSRQSEIACHLLRGLPLGIVHLADIICADPGFLRQPFMSLQDLLYTFHFNY